MDEEGPYCLPCGARLEFTNEGLCVFSRPHVEPDDDILAEVIQVAVEAGGYAKACRLLKRRRNGGV